MKIDIVTNIMTSIMNDVGGHGSFLKNFAAAFIAADTANKILLYPISLDLIDKYSLNQIEYTLATSDIEAANFENEIKFRKYQDEY